MDHRPLGWHREPLSPGSPISLPCPHAPSLEPVVATVAEPETDPVDVLPMGLECLPPRPGGFRPLGFCMMAPVTSGWAQVTSSQPSSRTCG